MAKVNVTKVGELVEISIDDANGTLRLDNKQCLSFISKLTAAVKVNDKKFDIYYTKNAIVDSYLTSLAMGDFKSKDQMLESLVEELLSQIESKGENEALSTSSKKIVKLRVPVKYISETAKEEDKEAFKVYKAIADDIALKGYGAIVFPAVRDEKGNPLFDLEVL